MGAETLYGRLKEAALKHADRTAIEYKKADGWIKHSFTDLIRSIESLSAFLSEQGVKKGDRIAIMLENRPEWPIVFFASASIGTILVTINPDIGKKEMADLLADSDCRMIFVKEQGFPKPPSVEKVISVESDEFKEAIQNKSRALPNDIYPDDTTCIVYTSGTTDKPKGVMLSHRNFLSNSDSLYRMNLGTYRDRVFAALPLDQNYPMTVTMILPLIYGMSVIYPGSMAMKDVIKAMEEARPTIFVGVPQVYHAFHNGILDGLEEIPAFPRSLLKLLSEVLYKVRNVTGLNLARHVFFTAHKKLGGSLRYHISGGAKLNENIAIGLAKFGLKILEGYGLSETSPVLTLNPPKKQKPGSAGVAIPDVEIRISERDEKGVGDVIARGPNIMKGYYKRPDLTASVIKDGWFHTGDLGYVDKDGYLFLTGRKKDVIVLSWGGNIHPEEIEKAYMKEVPLKEMCVFEAPAKSGVRENDVLWAVCVPEAQFLEKHGEENIREALKEEIEAVSRKLPHYKRIMGFIVATDPLPRTMLGKIKRYAVKERYGRGQGEQGKYGAKAKKLSKEDTELVLKETARKIIAFLKEHTRLEDISPGDSLELDLGIGFLDRNDIASGLEKTLNRKIKREIIKDAFTVRDLITGIGS
ncbi:MAG: AMP-binding protein [Candidatus Omnitrophota bacterium]